MGEKNASGARVTKPVVGIVMGSSSDLAVLQAAFDILKELGVPAEITVVSAHRTPDRMAKYAKEASRRGLKVIIAGAGGAAHLPGMIASFSNVPVIGVPILSSNSMIGLDSLLSIVQMPAGIPVATVAINGAKNAGLLAAKCLAIADRGLFKRLEKYQASLQKASMDSAKDLMAKGLPNHFDLKKLRVKG